MLLANSNLQLVWRCGLRLQSEGIWQVFPALLRESLSDVIKIPRSIDILLVAKDDFDLLRLLEDWPPGQAFGLERLVR